MGVTAWGIDYAFGNGLTVATMQANGVQFVCRYLSGGSNPKDLSAAELANLDAGGIAVVFNWETTGIETSNAQGVGAAQGAQAELAKLAAAVPTVRSIRPDGSFARMATASAPIIFSLDTDPTSGVIPGAEAYQAGVVSVIGKARSGAYGGLNWIKAAFDTGLITIGWQTYAWSARIINGISQVVWDSRAQLQQYQNGVMLGPANVDRDRAVGVAAPSPPPAPVSSIPLHLQEDHHMELKTGNGAVDMMRFPDWPSYLFLFSDVGLTGGTSTTVRVALHKGDNSGYDVRTVTLTAATPDAILTLPASTFDAASFARQDDGPPVGVSWRLDRTHKKGPGPQDGGGRALPSARAV